MSFTRVRERRHPEYARMQSNWRILAAVDISRPAEEPVEHAVALATALAADLDLLYVSDPFPPEHGRGSLWPVSALTPRNDVTIRRQVLQGSPATTIAARAESIEADVILMSSRTYGRWTSLWKRSVTEDVLSLSQRPVCITPAPRIDREYRFRNRRILCAVTLDGGDTDLIRRAEDVARRTTAELVLLHVVPEASEGLLHYAVEASTRPLSREWAANKLVEVASRLSVPATTSVMVGDPGKCIALASREHAVDLVLMSRARPQTPGVFGRSPGDVLSRLRCPLLTVVRDPQPVPRPVVEGVAAQYEDEPTLVASAVSRMRLRPLSRTHGWEENREHVIDNR